MHVRTSYSLGKPTWHAAALVLLAVALWASGREFVLVPASAAPPEPTSPEVASDYSRRVVAYIYDTIPITREDLGEYLIARQGADRLELLVNKRIIEMECQKRSVEVTAAEVEAALEEDIKGLQLKRKDFVENVLQHYKKTLYEWKEDVIRPRLQLGKLCVSRVHVTDEDLHKAFTSHYGEKIEGRIILFPPDQKKFAMNMWEKVRNSEEEFAKAAQQQANAALARVEGRFKPIGRYTSNDKLEEIAFSLEPGQIGPLVESKEGTVIFKCDKRLPPDASKHFEDERAALEKEVLDKKIQQEIPIVFKEMRDTAKPKLILQNGIKEEDLVREVKENLGGGKDPTSVKPKAN